MEGIRPPFPVQYILDRLARFGYEAYLVGGCVRDSLLPDRTPHDWDVCTNATPEDIGRVFSNKKLFMVGAKHGTVTVMLDNGHNQSIGYEITTYRVDGEYKDNRHPDNVTFVSSLEKDLERRDFTINAMAWNYEEGIVDIASGISDLNNKTIRCVGNPDERFQEDALRILRAIRFASQLGFVIDAETRKAMYMNMGLLKNISPERIRSELIKILDGKYLNSKLFFILMRCLTVNIGEMAHISNFTEIFERFKIARHLHDEISIFSAIFDFDINTLRDVLTRMKFDNKTINAICTQKKYGAMLHNDRSWWNDKNYMSRKLLNEIGVDGANKAITYARMVCEELDTKQIKHLFDLDILIKEAAAKGDIYSLSALAVDGNDMINIGVAGKDIGTTLNYLLDSVMREKIKNNSADLMTEAKRILCVRRLQ